MVIKDHMGGFLRFSPTMSTWSDHLYQVDLLLVFFFKADYISKVQKKVGDSINTFLG